MSKEKIYIDTMEEFDNFVKNSEKINWVLLEYSWKNCTKTKEEVLTKFQEKYGEEYFDNLCDEYLRKCASFENSIPKIGFWCKDDDYGGYTYFHDNHEISEWEYEEEHCEKCCGKFH